MTREDFIHHAVIAQISNPKIIPYNRDTIIKEAIGLANCLKKWGVGFDDTTHVLQEEVKKQEITAYDNAIDRFINESPF